MQLSEAPPIFQFFMHPFLSLPSAYVWFRTSASKVYQISTTFSCTDLSQFFTSSSIYICSFLRIRFSRIRLSLFREKRWNLGDRGWNSWHRRSGRSSSWSCAQFLRDSRLRRRRWVHECLQSTRNQSRTSWRARARQRWREAEGRGWNRDRRTKPWSRDALASRLGTKLNLSNEGPLHLSSGPRYGRRDQPSPLLFLLLFLLVSSPRKHLLACLPACLPACLFPGWLTLFALTAYSIRLLYNAWLEPRYMEDSHAINMLIILVFDREKRIWISEIFLPISSQLNSLSSISNCS